MARPEEVFSKKDLEDAEKLVAYELRSGVFINDGKMTFTFRPFPKEAQFSTINSLLLADIDTDGLTDIVAGGNFFEVNIQRGRYDASYGLFLKNLGDAAFGYVPQYKSGLKITGQIRDIKTISYQGSIFYMVGRNNNTIQFLKLANETEPLISKTLY